MNPFLRIEIAGVCLKSLCGSIYSCKDWILESMINVSMHVGHYDPCISAGWALWSMYLCMLGTMIHVSACWALWSMYLCMLGTMIHVSAGWAIWSMFLYMLGTMIHVSLHVGHYDPCIQTSCALWSMYVGHYNPCISACWALWSMYPCMLGTMIHVSMHVGHTAPPPICHVFSAPSQMATNVNIVVDILPWM